MKKLISKLLLAATFTTLLLLTVGCGTIPSAYRGNFEDSANNVQLTLEASGGVFTTADGRKLIADTQSLNADNLIEGQPGIYTTLNPAYQNRLEIYWINPDLSTRKEEGGLMWFNAEVFYTLLDIRQEDTVNEMEFFHCDIGKVMIDMPTQRWQIGCPADPDYYRLVRIPETN
jgi:hypothetical protein